MSKKLTISVPCFERPQRTRRVVKCIAEQTLDNWEVFIVGDGCGNIKNIIETGEFKDLQKKLADKGNDLYIENLDTNYGGWGYEIINRNIQRASGDYFIFVSNDDYLLPDHFENYYQFMIENNHLDFSWFNTYLKFSDSIRYSDLYCGGIGHAELIVKTEFIKTIPKHTAGYGHDWEFIVEMMKRTSNYAKAKDRPATYWVTGIPGVRESDID